MRLVRFALASIVLFWPFVPALKAQRNPEEGVRRLPMGSVELTLRDPQGKPLKQSPVEILLFSDSFTAKPSSVQPTTDERGVARFSCDAGVLTCRITVKKVGYGATGTFEVLEGETKRATAPPLLPFSVIEGTIPVEARKEGAVVRASGTHSASTVCDDKGYFVFHDVPCGSHELEVFIGEKSLGLVANLRVEPGQRVRARFVKRSAEAAPSVPAASPLPQEKPAEVVWASGVVRNEKGRAIQGATVYAIVTFFGAIRMYERIQSVQTDAEGRWTIEGEGNLMMSSSQLVAHKKGHLPVIRPLPLPYSPPCELILPDRGGKLDVILLDSKKPCAGASVQLSGDGTKLYSSHYVGSAHGPEQNQLTDILYPTATTDAEGMAHFANLLPGIYTIHAVAGDKKTVAAFRENVFWHQLELAHASAHGVVVRAGETKRFRLNVYPQPNLVRMRVGHADGKLLSNRSLSFTWGLIENGGRSISLTLDDKGIGEHAFESPGLWSTVFHYRNSPANWFPIQQVPYYEAAGIVAVSPLLPKEANAPLTASRHEPGTLLVQLRYSDGEPARGFVLTDGFGEKPAFAAACDDKGIVRFEGMQAWQHELKGYLVPPQVLILG